MKRNLLLTLSITAFLMSCQPKSAEQIPVDSVMTSRPEQEPVKPNDDAGKTVRIFPLDSILEINYYAYNVHNKIETSGVNIINRQTKRWLFDSEGPQIESYSDIQKIDDTHFVVSVYYDVPASNDTKKHVVRIAKFDLTLDLKAKTYTFLKDSLFWPTPPPFNSTDTQKTIHDYQKLLQSKFLSDSTNNDQPDIQKMFEVQERLLSSFISGCDSCALYSDRLFQKYDHALFASDSDYAGEIGSVFKILTKH